MKNGKSLLLCNFFSKTLDFLGKTRYNIFYAGLYIKNQVETEIPPLQLENKENEESHHGKIQKNRRTDIRR